MMTDFSYPCGKGRIEFFWVDVVEDIIKGVMTGNTMFEIEEFSEPFYFGFSIFFNGIEIITTADNGADGDGQNVNKRVT